MVVPFIEKKNGFTVEKTMVLPKRKPWLYRRENHGFTEENNDFTVEKTMILP